MEVDNSKLVKTEITLADMEKIGRDLAFIKLLSDEAKKLGCRVVIHGGYAADGNLGVVTRPHNDIDLQIIGKGHETATVQKLLDAVSILDSRYADIELADKGKQEYYHAFAANRPGFGADLYFVEVTTDPFADERVVVKNDGSKTEVQRPDIQTVTLNGVTFEAVSPLEALMDRLWKRDVRGDKKDPKYDQDIDNLKLITDSREVSQRMEEMKK